MSSNRRSELRARLLQRGRIVTNGGFTVIDCIVLDVSYKGAKLKVSSTFGLPDQFELRLAGLRPRRVEVRHRTPQSVGVRFTD